MAPKGTKRRIDASTAMVPAPNAMTTIPIGEPCKPTLEDYHKTFMDYFGYEQAGAVHEWKKLVSLSIAKYANTHAGPSNGFAFADDHIDDSFTLAAMVSHILQSPDASETLKLRLRSARSISEAVKEDKTLSLPKGHKWRKSIHIQAGRNGRDDLKSTLNCITRDIGMGGIGVDGDMCTEAQIYLNVMTRTQAQEAVRASKRILERPFHSTYLLIDHLHANGGFQKLTDIDQASHFRQEFHEMAVRALEDEEARQQALEQKADYQNVKERADRIEEAERKIDKSLFASDVLDWNLVDAEGYVTAGPHKNIHKDALQQLLDRQVLPIEAPHVDASISTAEAMNQYQRAKANYEVAIFEQTAARMNWPLEEVDEEIERMQQEALLLCNESLELECSKEWGDECTQVVKTTEGEIEAALDREILVPEYLGYATQEDLDGPDGKHWIVLEGEGEEDDNEDDEDDEEDDDDDESEEQG